MEPHSAASTRRSSHCHRAPPDHRADRATSANPLHAHHPVIPPHRNARDPLRRSIRPTHPRPDRRPIPTPLNRARAECLLRQRAGRRRHLADDLRTRPRVMLCIPTVLRHKPDAPLSGQPQTTTSHRRRRRAPASADGGAATRHRHPSLRVSGTSEPKPALSLRSLRVLLILPRCAQSGTAPSGHCAPPPVPALRAPGTHRETTRRTRAWERST